MTATLPIPLTTDAKPAPKASLFRVAVYEGAGAEPLPPGARTELVCALLAKGFSVSVIRANGTVSATNAGTLVVLGQFAETKPERAEDGEAVVHFRDIRNLPEIGRASCRERVCYPV